MCLRMALSDVMGSIGILLIYLGFRTVPVLSEECLA